MNGPIIAYRGNIGVQTSAPFANTYSLDFDGIDDKVDCGTIPHFTTSQTTFSVSFWFKNTTVGGNAINIGGKIYFVMASNRIECWNLGNVNGRADTTGIIFGNTWHNLTYVFDGSGATNEDRVKVYVDGVLNSVIYQNTQPTSTTATSVSTFISASPFGAYYNGNVDEVSIFDSAISIADVWDGSGQPTDLTSLNPIAWYRNGDNGSYKSPQWLIPSNENKDKVSNYSLLFDGVDDRVQLSSDFVASGEFTVSFWMKPISAGSPISEIYPIGTFPGNSNYVKLDQIGVMWLRLGGVNAIFNEAVYGGGSNNLVLNNWQNIVFIRDSLNIIRCYRNGVDFGYNVAAATNSNTLTLNSFGRIITNSFGYEGGLDEIAFWNSDETANLSSIYNGGEPTTISGSVAHYKMGEEATFSGGVWTVPDAVGSNNGTSNAMTIDDRVGEAPSSENNALSFNMDLVDRTTDVPT